MGNAFSFVARVALLLADRLSRIIIGRASSLADNPNGASDGPAYPPPANACLTVKPKRGEAAGQPAKSSQTADLTAHQMTMRMAPRWVHCETLAFGIKLAGWLGVPSALTCSAELPPVVVPNCGARISPRVTDGNGV